MHNPKNQKEAQAAFEHELQQFKELTDPFRLLKAISVLTEETQQRANSLTPIDWQEIGALNRLLISFAKTTHHND